MPLGKDSSLKHKVGGIHQWSEDNGEGASGWTDWYNEETGEDDPMAYWERITAKNVTDSTSI